MLQTIAANAGIDKRKAHPHALRHFFAKSFYDKTHDLVMLSNILGHSDISTTKKLCYRYVRRIMQRNGRNRYLIISKSAICIKGTPRYSCSPHNLSPIFHIFLHHIIHYSILGKMNTLLHRSGIIFLSDMLPPLKS